MKCPGSNQSHDTSSQIDPKIPVECPECGAIRKIPGTQIWSDMFIYPNHQQPDSSRLRLCYKRNLDGDWELTGIKK